MSLSIIYNTFHVIRCHHSCQAKTLRAYSRLSVYLLVYNPTPGFPTYSPPINNYFTAQDCVGRHIFGNLSLIRRIVSARSHIEVAQTG